MAESIDKTRLIAELATSRERISDYAAVLRRDLDFGARLKVGVANHPAAWFAGAAVLGLLLSKIPATRRKVKVKGIPFRGNQTKQPAKAVLALSVLKFGLDFAKPALVAWVKQRLTSLRAHSPKQR